MPSDLNRPLNTKRQAAVLDADKTAFKKSLNQKTSRPAFGLAALFAVLILGGSIYTALDQDPLMKADQSAQQSPSGPSLETRLNNHGVKLAVDPTLDQRDGGRQNSVTNIQSDLSGDQANVETTVTDSGLKVSTFRPSQNSDLPSSFDRNAQTQNLRLAHIPNDAITQDSPYGPLPIRGSDGSRAVDVYARPWSGARGVRIAIIVGGMGLSQTGSDYALKTLAPDITLGFAANGNSLRRWATKARQQGHEILLQIPLEPFNYPNDNPGRGTLEVAFSPLENLKLLHDAMGRITNYTGIGNFMGARFLSDPNALDPIMKDIAKRGLLFFDDGSSAQSRAGEFSKALNIPFAASDILIDAIVSTENILKKLDELERIARANGTAIGIASAFPASVDAIALWSNEAKARGIEIVGISALASQVQAQ